MSEALPEDPIERLVLIDTLCDFEPCTVGMSDCEAKEYLEAYRVRWLKDRKEKLDGSQDDVLEGFAKPRGSDSRDPRDLDEGLRSEDAGLEGRAWGR